MQALIIGAAGFVGSYLIDEVYNSLTKQITASKLPNENFLSEKANIVNLDILKMNDIINVLKDIKPEYIFHLAAQSSVALSWKNPSLTIDINIKGSINLLEAIRRIPNYKPRILMIGSGEEYGHINNKNIPISEDLRLNPGNIYAATKASQNMLSSIYAQAYDMGIIMTRSFNHIGPGQAPMFVVSDFCKQVSEIEKNKQEPIIHVGNLEAKRDFLDVRDVVNAYVQLITNGKTGNTYNIGSGKAIAIQDILDIILKLSDIDIKINIDDEKIRPIDIPIIVANISKIKNDINWSPKISLQTTIEDTLNYWRNKND